MASSMGDWPHLVSEEVICSRAAALAKEHIDMLARLVEIRVDSGMSQTDVAELMGVSQQRVSSLEQYDSDPKLSTVRRYANAVGALIDTQVRVDESDAMIRNAA